MTLLTDFTLLLFRVPQTPLKCVPQTRTARINDGHASYFAEAPCLLAPQC